MSFLLMPQRYAVPGTPPPAETQWRINVTALQDSSGSRHTEIGEIEMHTVAGGADQCNGGTASGSGHFFVGVEEANAFANDGCTTTWISASSAMPQWVGYTLPSALSIIEVALTCNAVTGISSPPTLFDVQYFDGASWITAWSVTTAATWTTGETRVFTKP